MPLQISMHTLSKKYLFNLSSHVSCSLIRFDQMTLNLQAYLLLVSLVAFDVASSQTGKSQTLYSYEQTELNTGFQIC